MDFLSGLNPQQREAVATTEGPVLILAGAGSGKTRVITHRISHLISANHVPPSAVLAVTFTNKAAGEMRSRVASLLEELALETPPLISTFHSFCVRLLRRDGDALASIRPGFTRTFSIYDDEDQLSIIKAAYKRMGLDEKAMPYRATLSQISQAKSVKKTPQEMYSESADPRVTKVAAVYEEYEKALRQANALDFDDLLLESVRLLYHDADTRNAWNRRLSYIMIDEYQDTNRSQYELMRLLTQSHDNVCVVGDEDQSIYSWRGADIRNILDFEKDYPEREDHPPGAELPLDEEHSRSRQRRSCEQQRAQRQVALDGIRRRRHAQRLRRLRRRERGALHRRHHRENSATASRTGAWRFSTARIRNRARLKKRCAATTASTTWWAASVTTSAPK